ncbi:hypothetical protein, partial [Roseovarius aestuariivivens]|uniref:hypothetical protein n=1 Tax=Roseovarius aestuariivivens TaxID=1888910 RepID=UPI0014369CD7
LYTHASLGLPRNEMEEEREPDLVVIDEGFLSSMVGDFPKVSAEDVRRHIKHDSYRYLGRWIVDALADEDGARCFELLKDNGVTKEDLSEIDLSAIAPSVSFEPESDRPASLPSAKTCNALRGLIRVLREEWDLPHRTSPARLWYDADSNEVTVCRRKELRINDRTPVLLLDATADPLLLDELLPFTDFSRIDVRQNAIVVQVYDQTGSNTFWNENEDKVEQLVEVLKAWVSSGERPLLISHKPLAARLRTMNLEGVKVGHFGGIRGSNEFEYCTVVFITGRNSPPAALVEQQARAIFWEAEPPLVFEDTSDHLPLMLQGYWQSEKNQQPQSGVLINVFRDPRIAAVHQQIREAETIQAIARLRLVWAEHPKYVFMLGNLPVELPVDRLRTASDMFPDRLELELLKDGHIPLTARSLRKLKPDLCTSEDAARMMLSRSNVTDPTALDFLTPQMKALATKATYRAGDPRLTEHTHLFLPTCIEPLEEGSHVLFDGTVGNFRDLSEIEALLEEGWGEGNVQDLRIDGWAADGTEVDP